MTAPFFITTDQDDPVPVQPCRGRCQDKPRASRGAAGKSGPSCPRAGLVHGAATMVSLLVRP